MTDSAQKPEVRGKPFTGKDDPRHNAGGRPKVDPRITEALRQLTIPALDTLQKILKDYASGAETSKGDERVPAAVARAAADSILDRVAGKAPAAPEDNDAISRGLGFTRDEVAQMLLGRRLPERSEDPLAIPATTKE